MLKTFRVSITHSSSVFYTCSFPQSLSFRNIQISQKCFFVFKPSSRLLSRNINENTLADTPSGYIMDPANHPKQMVTYEKLSTAAQVTLDTMEREEELMSREELAYGGYTTLVVQEAKSVVFSNNSCHEELLSSVKSLEESLNKLEKLVGSKVKRHASRPISDSSLDCNGEVLESNDLEQTVLVSEDDCNHVRYIIALAMRRLGNFKEAERRCMEILKNECGNSDAIESLIEIFTGTEQPAMIRVLLDNLEKWYEDDDSKSRSNGEIDSKKDNGLQPVEVALVLLADVITEASFRHYSQNGEGSTSRFFIEALSPIARELGSKYLSKLIETLYRTMDEQHFAARFESGVNAASKQTVGFVVSFLKALLARDLFELSEDPVVFEFDILSKLHAALRYGGRKHESYKVCERLLNLYRNNSTSHLFTKQQKIPDNHHGLLDEREHIYKTALFQYVEDRALDSLNVGKHLCIQAIEEYPEEAYPWETLSLILHKEDPVKGLNNALIAANRAFSLDSMNLRVILTLANFYKAQKRYKLYETMMDRYRLLQYMIENEAGEEDMKLTIEEIKRLDTAIPREAEPNDVDVQFADIREYNERMEAAHTYSMPVDKEPRIFGEQPVSAPMLDPLINTEKPERLIDIQGDHSDCQRSLGK